MLEQEHADQICDWALATLRDPQNYYERARPTFVVRYKIIYLPRSMVWTLSECALHKVIDYLLDQAPITDIGTAQTLARLIQVIPESAWTESHRQRAAKRSKADAAYLREAYLAVAAQVVPESREEIHQSARAGELITFDAIDDVERFRVTPLMPLSTACGVMDSRIENATKGIHDGGGLDPGHALSLLSVWHPPQARWDRIAVLLSAPHVSSEERSGPLELLAIHGALLADEAKKQLVEHVSALRDRVPAQHFLDDNKDIRGLAAEAFAALTNESSRSKVVRELLCGNAVHRASSARIIERHGDEAEAELLLALAGDTSTTVRDAALSGLSKLVTAGRASDSAMAILLKALASGGTQSATAVVSRLILPSEVSAVTELLAVAAEHPSAQIRHAVRKHLFP